MKLTLGFSPCPNDTFIFDALVNNKIDTDGFEFDVVLADVETLNQWAIEGRLDVTKLSFPAFFQSMDKYILLNSGSALGKGVGPLLVKAPELQDINITNNSILIPGINTTANLLLSFAFPEAKNKRPMLFSEIEDLVVSGLADLGVIIHENRFTYQQKGLQKVADLGEIWEEKMKTPIPLGGIAIKKSLDKAVSLKIDKLIRKSLEYAFANYPLITDYVKQHSQTMNEEVIRQHIELYVNKYSLQLGDEGRAAIEKIRDVFFAIHHIADNKHSGTTIFLS
ncbi:MAG TPA: 1,4-dihydroxy-6-naphthoate synthase [Chitinophagaceae bacterium]|nr:1,4-dihydroxy-6-naphthoate synthase [Chitinophagaceae bacterium]